MANRAGVQPGVISIAAVAFFVQIRFTRDFLNGHTLASSCPMMTVLYLSLHKIILVILLNCILKCSEDMACAQRVSFIMNHDCD